MSIDTYDHVICIKCYYRELLVKMLKFAFLGVYGYTPYHCSPLVRGGVGPSSLFVPGAVGPLSSFGLGPSFAVHGAGGSLSCVDGAAGGSIFRGWRCWGLIILFVGGGGVL